MEDAATAEISRVQIWQWRRHNLETLDDGKLITTERVRALILDEVTKSLSPLTESQIRYTKYHLAGKLVTDMLCGENLDEFLTTVCYPHIITTQFEGTTVPDFDAVSKL